MANENLRWAAYEPPTVDQLERRAFIRDRVEQLSIRPLRDSHLLYTDDSRRRRMGCSEILPWAAFILTIVVWVYIR
jgi:hypothetical protein